MERMSIDDMKRVELEIMDELDRICRAQGITYFLAYGSLLGAVRHGGFIPWDDDMDVVMLREDYERFITGFEDWKSQDRFALASYRDGKSIYPFVKMTDATTRVLENFVAKDTATGVWVDIFPLDDVDGESAGAFRRNGRLSLVRNFIVADPSVGSSGFVKLAKRVVCPFARHLDAVSYARRIDENACAACAGRASDTVADIVGEGRPDRVFPKKLFEPIEMKFEGRSYLAPAGYERFLEIQYGDWRTPPPHERPRSACVRGVSPMISDEERGEVPPPLSTKANMLWNSIGSMTYLACQWLVTIFVVRLSSGYDDAGLLSLAMSVVGIFSTFANYKMGTYQISDIRHENTLGEYFGFRCLTLGLAFIACMAYAFFTCAPHTLLTIALFYLYKGVGLLIDILHGADQQHRRMDYIGKSFIAQGVLSLGAFVTAFWLARDLNIAILAMTAAALSVFFAYDLPRASQFERVSIRLSREKALYFLKTSLPAVIASLAASAIFTVPKQYLAALSGEAALGIYASVAAPALVIQMGAMYLYGPLLDVFPKHYFEGDKKGFVTLMLKTVVGIVAVAVACAIILEFIGSWVLQLLFGQSIAPYVYLLQPILLSTVATAFLWFFGDVLITLRDFRANFLGNVASLVAVIPLTFFCVNTWGMNGVSFAGAGACLIGVLLLLTFLVRAVERCPAPRDTGGGGDRV